MSDALSRMASAMLALLAGMTVSLSASAGEPISPGKIDPKDASWDACRLAAHEVNRGATMPESLLAAISVTETGITNRIRREITPWPWTINVQGKGYRFASKDAAVAAVRRFMGEGARSIDVGCMQINLRYHPRAFTSLEEAFDPISNITYAAAFLKHLRARRANWKGTIESYHSYGTSDGIAYRAKVDKYWAHEKKRLARAEAREKAASDKHLKSLAAQRTAAVLTSLGTPLESAFKRPGRPHSVLAAIRDLPAAPQSTRLAETALSKDVLRLTYARPAYFADEGSFAAVSWVELTAIRVIEAPQPFQTAARASQGAELLN